MKAHACALLLALAVGATGCSAYRNFTFSGPEGKTCLSKCESSRWACQSKCDSDTICAQDCEEAAKACRKNCPDISAVEPVEIH